MRQRASALFEDFAAGLNKRIGPIPGEASGCLFRVTAGRAVFASCIERAAILSAGPVLRLAVRELKHPAAGDEPL